MKNDIIKKMPSLLAQFLFPKICSACNEPLYVHEHIFCTKCRVNFPRTDFHINPKENPISRVFWGRVPIRNSIAYLLFLKEGKTQHALHQLKYHKKTEVAYEFGKMYGQELLSSNITIDVDFILPVPLHPKKLAIRGFNQSLLFAQGLTEALNIPTFDNILLKGIANESQTKKNRIDRWHNAENAYYIANNELCENKKILLVDDVITTGATLESCTRALINASDCTIDIACIAYAGRML